MGGFNPIEIYFFDGTTRTVIGKEYVLPNGNEHFKEKMDSAKADILNGNLKGKLTAVIYPKGESEDSSRYFIGVAQDSIVGIIRIPAEFDYRQFKTDRIYKIFITQSSWVAPAPHEIEEMMELRAIEEGEMLKPYTFEIYYEDGSFSIEKWVR